MSETIAVGGLSLQSDKSQDYLVSMDKEIQITNKSGEVIKIATSISEIQQNSNGMRNYVIEGKVTDNAVARKGMFRGKINATINYL
ncbi:MAG: hypothetical protein U5J95_05680 [Balneolaceae bacterium]|nr:hypothetical protein [Balneolaceae bacterium]